MLIKYNIKTKAKYLISLRFLNHNYYINKKIKANNIYKILFAFSKSLNFNFFTSSKV